MLKSTDDVHIRDLREIRTPAEVIQEFPRTDAATRAVLGSRHAIHNILAGLDDRVLVVAGPCSIHDPAAALDYAGRLVALRHELAGTLEIVMRVYFEKPRTTVGWKGLINDPDLDGRFDIDNGLRLARSILLEVNNLGLPAGCEFLDMTTPQYFADLVAWGAIGARTIESQVHRELASGLSCPVGFKNGTDGNVRIALDAIISARQPHHFLAVTKAGRVAVAATSGNADTHIILRGGRTPNYDAASVAAVAEQAEAAGIRAALMIDASHANSLKMPENQPLVVADVAAQVSGGERRIIGVMAESNLVGGRQELVPGQKLVYGQSITDGCLGWEDTSAMLRDLAGAVELRRARASMVA